MGVFVEGSEEVKTLWCSSDYLGLGARASVRDESRKALEKFTVGSCGPRGFYGTTISHLDLERILADFLGTEESITYSDPTATVVSVIPAFAKRGDVLLIDSEANYGIQQGARLSRSKVVWWEHNNMEDLEKHLRAVEKADLEGGRGAGKGSEQRRFIVVEGLYANSGSLCKLPKVMQLAHSYKWRVILDDSLGFGVLGPTGKGTAERFGMTPSEGPHVTVGSLATTLGSVGGFCVGSREVVDHQRLSGVGYCFSASAPPYLCAAAGAALSELRREPYLVGELERKSQALHESLVKALTGRFHVCSDPSSPTKHLKLVEGGKGKGARQGLATPPRLRPPTSGAQGGLDTTGGSSIYKTPTSSILTHATMMSPTTQKIPALDSSTLTAISMEERELDLMVARAVEKGVLLSRSHAIPGEPFSSRPTLKFHVTLRHTDADVKKLVAALKDLSDHFL